MTNPVTTVGGVAIHAPTTQANAPADTRLATLWGGMSNQLTELVTGAGPAGLAPSGQRNPQGTAGVDLSGPPWGPADGTRLDLLRVQDVHGWRWWVWIH